MKNASQSFCLSVLLLVMAFLIADQQPAHAYLDPGTGSYAAQVILAGVLVAFFSLRTALTQFIFRASRLFHRNTVSNVGKKAAG